MHSISRDDIAPGAIVASKLGNPLHRKPFVFCIGDVAADSDAIKVPLMLPVGSGTIKKVLIGADTAIVAADTDYQTVNLTDVTNVIATVSTGPAASGQAFSAGVFVSLDIDADYANFTTETQLQLEFVKTGNGMAISGVVVQIDVEYDDPT